MPKDYPDDDETIGKTANPHFSPCEDGGYKAFIVDGLGKELFRSLFLPRSGTSAVENR